jgi:hypothetical protein
MKQRQLAKLKEKTKGAILAVSTSYAPIRIGAKPGGFAYFASRFDSFCHVIF